MKPWDESGNAIIGRDEIHRLDVVLAAMWMLQRYNELPEVADLQRAIVDLSKKRPMPKVDGMLYLTIEVPRNIVAGPAAGEEVSVRSSDQLTTA